MINLKELSDADLEILKHDVDKEIQSRVKAHQQIWLEYNQYKGSGKCWVARIDENEKVTEFLKVESVAKDGYKGKKLFLVPLVEGNTYLYTSEGTKSYDSKSKFIVKNGKLEKQ